MPGVLFPQLGFATAEGTVLNWLHAVGERVEAGAPLVEIASEKAVSVVAAPGGGVLLAIFAPPGAIVPEGETLGWIGEDGERPPEVNCRWLGWEADIAPPPEDLAQRLASAPAQMSSQRMSSQQISSGKMPAQGEPSQQMSSGEKHGAFPSVLPPQQVDKRYRKLLKKQMRETTGKRMAKSWVDAPKVDLFAEINFSAVVAHREGEKRAGRQPPPFNVYIVHAVVKAFEEFPQLNCQWINGRRQPLDGIHVAVAVALDESLLTISLKNLGGLSLREVERRYRSLIRKAAAMTLEHGELYGSSLTVTNLGEFEIFGFTAVINPPEVYILAIGELKDRTLVVDGEIVVAPVCYVCLSFDHRGVDGAPASRLLRSIKHNLEDYRDENSPAK